MDKQGNVLDVVDDEVVLPEDAEGETRVDKFGNLLDGRQYRCRVFTILGRGDRLYMLSTEPARCIGFRDSYLFFQKHKQLYKIIIGDEAKLDLIARHIIPHSYKGRAIGVVTARSVFREFGSRIVVGGRKIIDDYQVAEARANGDVEGELADPDDVLPGPGERYNLNQYVAWHGASSVYHATGPTLPAPVAVLPVVKRQVALTDENWMLQQAFLTRYVVLLNLCFPYTDEPTLSPQQPLQFTNTGTETHESLRNIRCSYQHDAIPAHHAAHSRSMGASANTIYQRQFDLFAEADQGRFR